MPDVVDDVLAVFDGVFVEESRGTTRVYPWPLTTRPTPEADPTEPPRPPDPGDVVGEIGTYPIAAYPRYPNGS